MRIRAKDFYLIPNILSLLRCLCAIPAYLLFLRNPAPFAPLFAVAIVIILTDFLDGYLARRLGQTSELGLLLDPLGDKLIMAASFIAMLQAGHIGLPLFLLIFGKDLLIAAAGVVVVRKTAQTPASNTHGKWASAALAFGITLQVAFTGSTLTPSLPAWLLFIFTILAEIGVSLGAAFALLSLGSYGLTARELLIGRPAGHDSRFIVYTIAAAAIALFLGTTRLAGILRLLGGS